jgi:hypothetical protein
MTAEEHMVTSETHLRYAEGHLQPSEEHLADAEVHLKLVNAHLAALDVAESTEAGSMGTVAPPPPEPSGGETDVGRTEVVPTEKERSPANRSRAGPVQRERKPAERAERAPPLERGRSGRALSASARIRRPTLWTSARGPKTCRLPRGGRRSKNGIAASAASRLPRQGDRLEVLLPNRVSAASLAETGSAAKNITRQGLRTTKATTSREGRRSGPRFQGRPP